MLLVDPSLLPNRVNETVERDTFVKYVDSRPSPRRVLGATAHALHFEATVVVMRSTFKDNVRFTIKSFTATAAGPALVTRNTEYRSTRHSVAEWMNQFDRFEDLDDLMPAASSSSTEERVDFLTTADAFMRFCEKYDYVVSNPSVSLPSDDSKKPSIQVTLSATDSPFFYPLNKTNTNHLYDTTNAGRHAVYLHRECEKLWDMFNRSIEQTAHEKMLTINPHTSSGLTPRPGSILYHTFKTLLNVDYTSDETTDSYIVPQIISPAPLFVPVD